MSDQCEMSSCYEVTPTTNASDREMAARLNAITEAGSLSLALPQSLLVGRGYDLILSTDGPDGEVSARTFYNCHVTAGALLLDGEWHPEHSAEDEARWRQRQVERWESYAKSGRASLASLLELANTPEPPTPPTTPENER